MHICVDKLTIIGSDNGLSPGRRQAIIWTSVGILLIEPLAGFPQLLKNHWNMDLFQDHGKIIEFHEKFLKFVEMKKPWKIIEFCICHPWKNHRILKYA